MPRIARVVVPGCPHHVTQRGTNRGVIFADDADRRKFLYCLTDWTSRTGTQIWAYCLMSNHFHLLAVPETESSLGRCMHGATSRYAQYFNEKYGRCGRLWQNRFFSCPVDPDRYLWVVAKYIEQNPVRAAVVRTPEDWPWSSAQSHLQDKGSSVLSVPSWLTEGERRDYRAFVSGSGEEEAVRRATATGRPLGTNNFYIRLEELLGRRLRLSKGGRPRKVTRIG